MGTAKLLPPCSYQGGKQRLAGQICDIIEEQEKSNFVFYDICCGSGAVSLEMINRGHHVMMIDKGPFGAVWEAVGNGDFRIEELKKEILKLPSVDKIGVYLKELSQKPVNKDRLVYQYLLLQAGAFGSKQVWIENGKWCNNSFRNYWEPTTTSNRRSPVNPMMPMPSTLYNRMTDILTYGSKYIKGYNIDIFDSIEMIKEDSRKKVIYIDPPYKNTTGYLQNFNIFEVIAELNREHIYVSEGFEFELPNCTSIVLSKGRKKGNISGVTRKDAVKEVLNVIS